MASNQNEGIPQPLSPPDPSCLDTSSSVSLGTYNARNPEYQQPPGAPTQSHSQGYPSSGMATGWTWDAQQPQSHPLIGYFLTHYYHHLQHNFAGVPTPTPAYPPAPPPPASPRPSEKELGYLPKSYVLLPSVAPEPVRKLLTGVTWEADAGSLAIDTVKAQLAHHETRRKMSRVRVEGGPVPSLFDAALDVFTQSIGEAEVRDLEALPPGVRGRVVWELEYVPYDFFRRLHIPDDDRDIDEWVLRNEVWLRDSSATYGRHNVASKRPRREDTAHGAETPAWTHGLVQLSAHADVVFPGSVLTDTCRAIARPNSLQGFKILDGRRLENIQIQPSVAIFAKKFEVVTSGLLKGLDWDHIFIAGGIVLGTLLCTDDKDTQNTPDQWKSSDVDLYICGLGPAAANAKIEHIFTVFKANLPSDAPVLVVRNAKTITFFSKYPLRRIQVVLKLVDSPRDVLLNFDLDICAVGWDGGEVWLLPRFARALETGYTVFTMDLINGHYLGDRRATREERVFKYADKGYGIRILPSYLHTLAQITADTEKQKALGIHKERSARAYRCGQVWGLRDFHDLVADARSWTATVVAGAKVRGHTDVPVCSHAMLQEAAQKSEDPQSRSALSGLSLFMRHVALWEHEVAGDIIIEKKWWAAAIYENMYLQQFGVGYNDIPDYTWDENYTTEGFIANMDRFNGKERDGLAHSLSTKFESGNWDSFTYNGHILKKYLVQDFSTQRITYSKSVHDILQPDRDVYLPVWLPNNFIDFAEKLILESVHASGVRDYATPALTPGLKTDDTVTASPRLMFWRITPITMWQLLHRAIDEVHEVIWSFHHANAAFSVEKGKRLNILLGHIAKRAVRPVGAQDEWGAFARWVARVPAEVSDYNQVFEGLRLPVEGEPNE